MLPDVAITVVKSWVGDWYRSVKLPELGEYYQRSGGLEMIKAFGSCQGGKKEICTTLRASSCDPDDGPFCLMQRRAAFNTGIIRVLHFATSHRCHSASSRASSPRA